ncbi:YitT family protein [Paenibacillus thiaminolyticus]|uniref:YitT family protein n=1 Tax=Paenibacillus thiaminolyticus TaxID=49283 RepID=UPI00116358E6|nr:YitT family protein [Paenibacillus thiaminolyticus]MDG0874715.1 YitT family protein [Paenibacillus thiaminolyticus]NGP57478.1 YitT family protein [Paenibacillus thiaminolyticus]WCF06789.1 YitT family protein [Paenibacillus thiaminolyticus]WCR27327.1 YitT family protein [Paenibacillus thiaminolyticus]WII36101.1 YitT family protein [Paenibacillus thiaminolyticus]
MKRIFHCIIIIFGAACIAASFNLFLLPHHLLSGGLSGVSLVTNYLTGWNPSILYFTFNLPILIWGWFVLGKRFIGYSILSVATTTWLLTVIPVHSVTNEPLLAAIFGGTLVGIGSGVSLRVGGSSGGFDIIGSIVTRYRDFSIQSILIVLNGAVIFSHGYISQEWELVLYSMVSIFTTGKIIGTIYINHYKVTVFIITREKEALINKLLCLPHGVTVIKTRGAFTDIEKDMLMTVTTRYELPDLKRSIMEIDPKAFVNIVETVGVIGNFRRPVSK